MVSTWLKGTVPLNFQHWMDLNQNTDSFILQKEIVKKQISEFFP